MLAAAHFAVSVETAMHCCCCQNNRYCSFCIVVVVLAFESDNHVQDALVYYNDNTAFRYMSQYVVVICIHY